MKRFLGKIFGIISCIIVLFMVINFVYYKTDDISGLVAFEVYDAINKTRETTEYTTVVLGDSVARQFFHPDYQKEDRDICFLATNQAITPAGNYILLEEYLKSNPQTEKVYYVVRPESLTAGINFHYSYSYFVTPFFNDKFKGYLEVETISGIEKIFGKLWTTTEYAKWLLAKYPKMLEMYHDICNSLNDVRAISDEWRFPDMSMTYLAKMKKICDEKNMELYILAVPLPEGYEFDFKELERIMENSGLKKEYRMLYESIFYIEAEEFVDEIHLEKSYVQVNREQIIKKIMSEEDQR